MTCAGLTLQLIAQQQLDRERKKPIPQVTESIDRGLAWLDANFHGKAITDRDETWLGMYWYAVERVGLAAGVSRLNGADWYLAGARDILSRESGGRVKVGRSSPYFNSFLETTFSLAFLARGRVPLWINKLRVPGIDWNNRPNDLYFLSRHLSDIREAELNWQVVDITGKPEEWMRAPVMYLSSDAPFKPTDAQAAAIKRYLDLGGMLLVNPEQPGRGLTKSIEKLAEKLYPGRVFEFVAGDDPLATMVADISEGHSGGRESFRSKVRVLTNGARPLFVLFPGDWGYEFQAKAPDETEPWQYILNLYTSATDRGRLTNRLADPLPIRSASRQATGTIHVARASYTGNWDVEPLALEVVGIDLFNRTGFDIKLTTVPLVELGKAGAAGPALVHLAGTQAVSLTDPELAALETYINTGGTVLVETVGGLGDFADRVGPQIAARLKATPRWLDIFSPILDGSGIKGAVDATHARYRAYCRVIGLPPDRPEIGAIFVGDRPAVLISSRDLSMGGLGVRTYRVNGYGTESARQLLGNILLHAAQNRPRE